MDGTNIIPWSAKYRKAVRRVREREARRNISRLEDRRREEEEDKEREKQQQKRIEEKREDDTDREIIATEDPKSLEYKDAYNRIKVRQEERKVTHKENGKREREDRRRSRRRVKENMQYRTEQAIDFDFIMEEQMWHINNVD